MNLAKKRTNMKVRITKSRNDWPHFKEGTLFEAIEVHDPLVKLDIGEGRIFWVNNDEIEVVDESEPLPTKWCIRVTNESIDLLKDWYCSSLYTMTELLRVGIV